MSTFLPALHFGLRGKPSKFQKIGGMAVCAISVLVPSQGSERALKTSKMDFYYECYFLVHFVSRGYWKGHYRILSAKDPFIWTGCMVLQGRCLLVTVATLHLTLILARRVGT